MNERHNRPADPRSATPTFPSRLVVPIRSVSRLIPRLQGVHVLTVSRLVHDVRQLLSGLAGVAAHPFGGSSAPEICNGTHGSSGLTRWVTVVAATFGVCLGLASAPAFAALSYPFEGQLAPASGSFGVLRANSVAVNDFNGDTYVADSSSSVVNVFDSSGAQLADLDSSQTPAGSFGGGTVLVAANNTTGEVYVVDQADNVVDAFDSSGTYVCQITGSATPSATECNGPAGSATPAGGFSTPYGIAVNQATGDVDVLDANNGVVDTFTAGGALAGQVDLTAVPGGIPFAPGAQGIAVSGFNGHLYVGDEQAGVYEFDATGTYVTTWTGANTPAGSFDNSNVSVAVDDASGDVFITSGQSGFTDPSQIVTDVFDAAGNYLAQFSHSYAWPYGTAVDQATGKIYVSDDAFGASPPAVVDIFGAGVVVPDVTTNSATNVQPTSATLNGTVNPASIQLSDCHFDYGTDTSYGQTAPCVPDAASIPADASDHAVSADLTGLVAGTTYHFRLAAANANGANTGDDATFQTPPPPSIDLAAAQNLTPTEADLTAKINPNGFDTTYHFEYGTDTSYGTSVPVPDGDIGSGTSDVSVTQHLSGLSANTTYHWRIIATNTNGTTTSPDHTFIYATTGGALPDGRAYEQVTPAHKNGALIGATAFGLTEAAQSGSRLRALTLQCFANVGSCDPNRNGIGTPYSFDRTATGWQPTALAPPATTLLNNTDIVGNVDSGTEVFAAPTPPTGQDDWWARRSDGTFADFGPSTPPAQGPLPQARIESALTPDLSHFVWSHANGGWPFSADPKTIYEYAGPCGSPSACQAAQPLLVAVSGGPGSTDLISTCANGLGGSVLGGGPGLGEITQGELSADGRTVLFTARGHDDNACSASDTAPPTSTLYARIDGELPSAHTVPISERSPADCTTPACLASPPSDASFYGASADGSKVFFASTQQLTDDATQDPTSTDTALRSNQRCNDTTGPNGCNLYLYDFSRPAGHHLIDVSAGDSSGNGPRVQGPFALSPDGSHVYFVAQGVLTSEPNAQGQSAHDGADNLYLYDAGRGQTSFVVTLPDSDNLSWNPGSGARFANVTPDGRFLVFNSHGALTSDATSRSGADQIFRYDAQSGELIRISIGEGGFNDNGNRSAATPCSGVCSEDARIVRPYIGAFGRTDPTMSHDGAYVFFMSPVALTPHALDDVQVATDSSGGGTPQYAQNVYEWHAGHVSLISDGRDASKGAVDDCITQNSPVCLVGASASGHDVFFSTADPLVPQDTDTELDYYDARVGGGFPYTPPAVPCSGDSCQATPSTQPPPPTAASVTFSGPGNAKPGAPPAKVKVLSRVVHGSTFLLKVSVPGKGRLTITGAGIRTVRKSVSKAGTYRLRVALTAKQKRALKRRRRLKLTLRVAYAPAGGTPSSVTLSITDKA